MDVFELETDNSGEVNDKLQSLSISTGRSLPINITTKPKHANFHFTDVTGISGIDDEEDNEAVDETESPQTYYGNDAPIKPHQRRHSTSQSVSVEIGDIFRASAKPKKRASDFEQLKVLGVGAYGKVMLVRDIHTNKLYAQKQLKKASIVIEQRMVKQTMFERQILESVKHPYIVKLHYAIQDQHKLYLILQYAQGGELFTHLAAERMFSEDCAAFYGAQAASALCHLHKNGILYRDLKPENCLLDEKGNLLLTDFGLSKIAENDATCNSMLGTPEYMAPEVLMGEPYDYTVDWWSFGALLYDFMTGNPPFTGANKDRVVKKIVGQKYKANMPYYLSADAKDLLRRLLRKEPQRRLGYKQFDTIKSHRFFRLINWDDIEHHKDKLDPPIKPLLGDPLDALNFSAEFTGMAMSPAPNPDFPHLYEKDIFHGFSYSGSVPKELQ